MIFVKSQVECWLQAYPFNKGIKGPYVVVVYCLLLFIVALTMCFHQWKSHKRPMVIALTFEAGSLI